MQAGIQTAMRNINNFRYADESERGSCSVVSDSLQLHGLYSPWNSPGQNIGVGSLSLLQGIFSTQRSNPGLPHSRQILYQLSHKKNPPSNAGDLRAVYSIPGSGRYPGAGNGNPLQYCCLENPTDRGPWRAIVCGCCKEMGTTE